jgi:hypothetical protein
LKTTIFSLLYFLLLPTVGFSASLDKSDETWGALTTFVLSLFTGDPAIIASLVAFFMGIIFAMKTQHKLVSICGGLAIAVAFQLGPNIVEHLTGATI